MQRKRRFRHRRHHRRFPVKSALHYVLPRAADRHLIIQPVDVYTVLSYGVKISEVSKNIQERVKFSLENKLGITAHAVNVYIQNIKVVGE